MIADWCNKLLKLASFSSTPISQLPCCNASPGATEQVLLAAAAVSVAKCCRLLPIAPEIDLLFANVAEARVLVSAAGLNQNAEPKQLAESLLEAGFSDLRHQQRTQPVDSVQRFFSIAN